MPTSHSGDHMELFEAMMAAKNDQELFALRPHVMEYIHDIVLKSSVIITEHDLDIMRDREDHNSLVESLFDLTNYDDTKLLGKAFEMLHRIINTNSEIFRLAEESRLLIEPTSLALVDYMDRHMSDFRDLGAGIVEHSDMA